jgi:transcriptional antiterminator RfaH
MNETPAGWFVAHTKPRAELIAQENLLRQNYQVRLPMVRKIVRRRPSLEPLFPRYLFVQPTHLTQSLSPIRSTTGVSTLVRFGMNLARLSESQCDRIMAFAAAQQEGGLNAMLEIQGIRVGQKVLIKEGPFVGLEGLVSTLAKDRVMVLMNLLGKEQTLSFPATDLSAA